MYVIIKKMIFRKEEYCEIAFEIVIKEYRQVHQH
jgi:hypothetical protein